MVWGWLWRETVWSVHAFFAGWRWALLGALLGVAWGLLSLLFQAPQVMP